MSRKLTLLPSLMIGLTSCSSSTPKCDDKDVKSLVVELSQETFETKAITTVNAIRLVGAEKETKSCECAATVAFHEGVEKIGEREVSYTAQYTTEGDIYVELMDVSDLYK